MTARRGTTNRNVRGSSYSRRTRREWLVTTFGDGIIVECALRVSAKCLRWLTVDTVTADRIVPGIEGGSYERGNIRPACLPCNSTAGGQLSAKRQRRRI